MKMTFKIVVIGGLIVFFAVVFAVVFVPKLVYNPPRTVIANEYNEIESHGRELFYSNGCNYCHTQYVRPEDTAMGNVSSGGDYYFDNPMLLGSERTGPDLSYIGRKRSEAWEIRHWKTPREMSPLSIMPSFEFISDEDLDAMAAYIFNLGNRVAAQRMILPPGEYTGANDPLQDPMRATGSDQPQGWPTWTAVGLQEGKEIYVANCLTCHGCAGNGLGSYAGTLIVTPADFKQDPIRNMPDDQWFWHVSEGIQGTVMPPWKESLAQDQRWKVIRYVQQIFARPVMHDPDEGDPSGDYAGLNNPIEKTVENLDQGKTIFTRECMVCHGDAGRGNGPYRAYLQPGPPDFGDGSYGDYTDADYFWRISEGVPWTAMPSWKVEYLEEERWKLVYYIRTIFTQTENRPPEPPEGNNFIYPDFYKESMRFPENVSFEQGKIFFLQQCSHCHGLAGDGAGWDGEYLNPKPADFRDMAGMTDLPPEAEGEHIAKVSYGIKDSAMPVWSEWLPLEQRWDAVRYLISAFMIGQPLTSSVFGNGDVPDSYVTVSSDVYIAEGHTISVADGKGFYEQYCATCHGLDGQGDGPGTQGNASKGPAAYPANMGEAYISWRIHDGVPETIMYPFMWLLTDSEMWDITVYLNQLTSTNQGGG
jgi:mono/diheme cytochrome c family protein